MYPPPVASTRAQRFGLITSLLGPFKFLEEAPAAAAADEEALQFLVFVGEVVAFLPFAFVADVVEAIRAIDSLVLVRGGGALESAKQELKRDRALTPGVRAQVFALCLLLETKNFLRRIYGTSTSSTTASMGTGSGQGAQTDKQPRTATTIDAVLFDKKQSPFADVQAALATSDQVLYHTLKALLDKDDTPDVAKSDDLRRVLRPGRRGGRRRKGAAAAGESGTPVPESVSSSLPAELVRRSSSAIEPRTDSPAASASPTQSAQLMSCVVEPHSESNIGF